MVVTGWGLDKAIYRRGCDGIRHDIWKIPSLRTLVEIRCYFQLMFYGGYMRIVHYTPQPSDYINVGQPAFVYPADHTSPLVSNTTWARTSDVRAYDAKTGVFVTLNSCYIPTSL